MAFRFQWDNDEQTVMRLIAEGDWNWRDYHHVARASMFSMLHVQHTVHVLIDLRNSTRTKMPGGIKAHAATFGKPLSKSGSGYAVVLGMPEDPAKLLPLAKDGTFVTPTGRVYFARSEEEAQEILASLPNDPLD